MLRRKGTGKYRSVLLMGGAVLLSISLLTLRSLAQQGGGTVQTMEGTISDGMCGANHSGEDAAKCTLACVNKGKGWVLVVEDKVYTLEPGRMEGISQLAGKKAKVTGRVIGTKIVVRSVDIPD